jgi:hypothetical protein
VRNADETSKLFGRDGVDRRHGAPFGLVGAILRLSPHGEIASPCSNHYPVSPAPATIIPPASLVPVSMMQIWIVNMLVR